MTTVFIAGSMSIKHLNEMFKERIENIVNAGFDIVVGDANGSDTSIQEHLYKLGATKTTVYCSGTPRNNVGKWPICVAQTRFEPGTRAYFEAKDKVMAEVADFGLMNWDTKSTGTLTNVIELVRRKKKAVVFINRDRAFKTVGTIEQLESLVEAMSDGAKRKADEKIQLTRRLEEMRHQQGHMFNYG
jgi:hypothetical protein